MGDSANVLNHKVDPPSLGKNTNENEGFPLLTAARGGGWSLLGAVSGASLGIFLQVLISRFYGPKYYGIFFTCFLLCNILQSIAALGLHKAGMRFISIGHERSDYNMILDVFKTASSISFLFGVAIAIVLYFMSSFIALSCFHNIEMVAVLKLFSVALPYFALLQVSAELSRGFKTTKYAVITENLLFPFLQIFLLFVFNEFGYNFFSAVYSFVFSVIICSLFMLLTVHNQIQNFMGPRKITKFIEQSWNYILPTNWKPILTYSLPLTPFGLLFLGGNSMDIFMLNVFTNSTEVGEYAAAARWVTFFLMIVTALNFIFGPLIAGKLGTNQMENVKMLYGTATRWMLFMTLPVSIFFILSRDPMMFLFGEQFVQFGPTVLLILSIGGLLTALSGSGGLLFVLSGHQYIELGMLSLYLLSSVLLNLLLIPEYGITGAAFATIFSNMVTVITRIVLIHRYLRIHPFSAHMFMPVVFFVILNAAGLFIQSLFHKNIILDLGLGIGSSLMVIISIITLGLDDHDRDLIVMFREKCSNLKSSIFA